MKAEDIVLGQTYRIRQWESMAEEFGVDANGDIPREPYFTRYMKLLCGREVKPTELECGFFDHDGWTLAPWMLEPLTSDDPEDTLP